MKEYKLYDTIYTELLEKLRMWTESLVGEFELSIDARYVDLQDVVELGNAISQVRALVDKHQRKSIIEIEDDDIFRGGKSFTEYGEWLKEQAWSEEAEPTK